MIKIGIVALCTVVNIAALYVSVKLMIKDRGK